MGTGMAESGASQDSRCESIDHTFKVGDRSEKQTGHGSNSIRWVTILPWLNSETWSKNGRCLPQDTVLVGDTTVDVMCVYAIMLMICIIHHCQLAVVAEWYRYRIVAYHVTSSSPIPLKTHRLGQRCTLNLSRADTSSRWCGVVVRRGLGGGGVPAQMSSTSLDHGSKLHGPSPKALV
ncbi:uncharacterized protein TNCV_700481 [Trichonephila clavipes]|nr:uncharacterized protein TNCV_700481 [Trichonephila clavipes]